VEFLSHMTSGQCMVEMVRQAMKLAGHAHRFSRKHNAFPRSVSIKLRHRRSQYDNPAAASSAYLVPSSELSHSHNDSLEILKKLVRSPRLSDGCRTTSSCIHFETTPAPFYGEHLLYPAFSPDGGAPPCSTRTASTSNMGQLCG
jgi:hypothetical protein